jgi:hypothetical protein
MAKNKKNKMREKKSIKTPLSGHKHVGKELLPPFATMKNKISLCSWMNDRLPEMLWAALILVSFERDEAFKILKRILNFILNHRSAELLHDITITGISKIEAPIRDELLCFIVKQSGAGATLSPLMFYDDLPAKDSWAKFLQDTEPDIDLLMSAVGACLWHQSQESTDCRWVRVMAQVVGRKLHIPKEELEKWCDYPNIADKQHVMSGIRAAEACPNPFVDSDLSWPKSFWHKSWIATPCLYIESNDEKNEEIPSITIESVANLYTNLLTHWKNTHATTSIDAKHDAVFGSAFYSIKLLKEIILGNSSFDAIGRLVIRTILEVRICLRFLILEDNEDMWKKWRAYGTGQAKLNALRFEDSIPPQYISLETIRDIANEDMWQEFVTINIGSWHALDLRKVSEKVGLKNEYDAYYSWTSGYVHGTWGAIRESCFNTCSNPLHRLHRFLDDRPLQATLSDAAILVDNVLADLDACYPGFVWRIHPDSPQPSTPE